MVDAGFIHTMNIEVIAGRAFSDEIGTDSVAFMLNEAAVKAAVDLAGPEWKSPLGKRVDYYVSIPEGWNIGKSGPVIGVIKNFHYRSLHHEVEPMALQINRTLQWKLLVRMQTGEIAETLAYIEQAMRDLGMLSERLFQYSFLDKDFNNLYRNEQRRLHDEKSLAEVCPEPDVGGHCMRSSTAPA